MRRRDLVLLAAGAIAASPAAWAQGRGSPFRVAVLGSVAATNPVSLNELAWLREGLETEGWAEGRDFLLDAAYADGDYGRFPALLGELLGRRPGAITVGTIAGAKAAQAASRTVPIVMLGLNDPVRTGLVASLASPGGNVTGLATQNEDLQLKLFGLMQEALPRARTVAAILNPENPSNPSMLSAVARAAAAAGLSLDAVAIPSPAAADGALRAIADKRPDVVFVLPDVALAGLLGRIVQAATAMGAPTIGTFLELPEMGGLLAYGFMRRDTVRRAASFLRRLAEGAVAADLPVEQPTAFRLIVSVRAAAGLGLVIPPSVLARADEVIE